MGWRYYGGGIAFEPIKGMCDIIEKKCINIENLSIINAATWNESCILKVKDYGSSSSVGSDGSMEIKAVDIDSVVKNNNVTFIKMDVEGSEMKSLEGAKNTIKDYRPRLAICIYHKPYDVIDIMSYLLMLVPEYKFWIRHYYSNMFETVLYASI